MQEQELIPHLFRTEYRKLVAVLSKLFGLEYIENAEDIVSDTFLLAAETWGLKGLPANPTAWLYTVSKNKARDFLRRRSTFQKTVAVEVSAVDMVDKEFDVDLSAKNIVDSQLQMMFALCHPSISVESQISLSLHVLCGFGVDEIADAFLTTRDVIYKRLTRAKQKLRTEGVRIEFPSNSEINNRLEAVLTTLYLLFSEGYYSASQQLTLRKDLCIEALRLTHMLIDNPATNTPRTNALMSLMCFHSSRFEARTNAKGDIILYEDQDTSLWNQELIERGQYFLHQASQGNDLSKFHCEAAIAYWHTQRDDTHEKWENILQLYNRLLQIEYSPIAALNRTYALSKANGKEEAIVEAEKLQLNDNHLYFSLLGHLYTDKNVHRAREYFHKSLSLAKSTSDKKVIAKSLQALNTPT